MYFKLFCYSYLFYFIEKWNYIAVKKNSGDYSDRETPDTFRTRKLSLSALMVLYGPPCGRVRRCRDSKKNERDKKEEKYAYNKSISKSKETESC